MHHHIWHYVLFLDLGDCHSTYLTILFVNLCTFPYIKIF
jgi:hypothetical protein